MEAGEDGYTLHIVVAVNVDVTERVTNPGRPMVELCVLEIM